MGDVKFTYKSGTETLTLTIPCDYAILRYKDAKMWLKLWNSLLFFLGIVLAATIIYLIYGVLSAKVDQGVIGAVGTVVEGAAMAWINNQMKDVRAEEKMMYEAIVKDCPDKGKVAQMLWVPT